MTEPSTVSESDAAAATRSAQTRKLLIAGIVALLAIVGVTAVVAFWWRHGGPRRAITGLAEDGAVKLADAVLDEVFGAA